MRSKAPPRKLPRKLEKVVAEAHALHTQIAILSAEYEKRALEIKSHGEAVYSVGNARAIVSEYEQRRTDWPAVVAAAKVPPRIIAKHTEKKPVKRLDWSEEL